MKNIFRRLAALLSFIFICAGLNAQYDGANYRRDVRPTKNLIVMIPDGTSISVVSAARWYRIYNGGGENLAVDPYFCGTVKTFSSNAPIGDSAPTTSAYMTGMPQQTGNVAIYPPADPNNDLVPVDPAMAYNPLATVLEAVRMGQGKATGLVVTVEFPHATPADCSAHYYKRSAYEVIASQMAHQNLDVMFGGGTDFVSEDIKRHFERVGISYYADDIDAFRRHESGKVWALWEPGAMPYDIDRDTEKVPSLREMTEKAIELLSQNDNGFFLMVEGSKVDWAAHDNDAVGCITEFLAFDDAVAAVMEFALRDGNTTVVILPDHGNSGFSIGRRDLRSYDKASLDKLFGAVSGYKRTGWGLEKILLEERPEDLRGSIKEYTGIKITDAEFEDLMVSKNYKYGYTESVGKETMSEKLIRIMNARTWFGFTTDGHTGEDVFLAAYHPDGDVPMGMNTNTDVNRYLSDAAGLEKRLPQLTSEIFAPHTEVFAEMKYEIDRSDGKFPVLEVKKGRKTLRIPAYTSVGYLNKKEFDIGSVAVYIDKTDTFYLPRSLKEMLE